MIDAGTVGSWDMRYRARKRCPTRSGGELYFESYGSGPPLVFINNFFTIAPSWRNFTEVLRTAHTIVAYDLQNQGASSQPGPDFPLSGHVEDLVDLLDHLELEGAYLVGTSISTLIARDAALRHPDRVRGLVLVGPAFSPFGHFRLELLLRDWRARLEQGGPRLLFDYLYPLVFSDRMIEEGGKPAYLALRERFLAVNSQEQIEACLGGVGEALAGRDGGEAVSQPTLLLLGDADYLWSRSTVEASGELLPGAESMIIAGAAHLPFLERTAEFERAVATFVAAHEGARESGGG